MTTAFVAGATGYTGREVVRVLRELGIETIAHVRPDSTRLGDWRGRFEALGARVDSTPWDPAAMTLTLRQARPELIFALLGTTQSRSREARRRGSADAGYEAVDFGLTMLLYSSATEAEMCPRFVYLSAAGVKQEGGNAYLAARARVERALRAGALPYTIARPSFITGPDRDEFRAGERIGAAVVDGVLKVVGWFGGRRLRERYRSTTNAVLARALVRLALDPAAAGRTFESEALRDT
jgi:nucleoside-diphosphate-sugar epimerase